MKIQRGCRKLATAWASFRPAMYANADEFHKVISAGILRGWTCLRIFWRCSFVPSKIPYPHHASPLFLLFSHPSLSRPGLTRARANYHRRHQASANSIFIKAYLFWGCSSTTAVFAPSSSDETSCFRILLVVSGIHSWTCNYVYNHHQSEKWLFGTHSLSITSHREDIKKWPPLLGQENAIGIPNLLFFWEPRLCKYVNMTFCHPSQPRWRLGCPFGLVILTLSPSITSVVSFPSKTR